MSEEWGSRGLQAPGRRRHGPASWVLLLALTAAPAAADEPPWDAQSYNPAPAEGDFLLPMPCGGQMAFRRVDTPAPPDWLADRRVTLGQAEDDTNYAEYLRTEYLAGSLSEGGVRFFYLGKYEVTRDQYAAVTQPACPAPSLQGRLPATGLTWFDGVAFGRAYTEWLLQHAPDRLPREGERRAFLRLPTETEWEYAARGGATVSEQAFRQRVFPIQGNLSDYAWFQGPRSAGGTAHPVGLLRPNPLGLHDLLGNAEELVLEPYRLNRVGREHGQPGGFVAKGGSFRTAEAALRSAMRTEYSYFDETKGAATRLDTIGLRLAVSAPVNVSLQRTQEYRRSWQNVPSFRIDTRALNPVDALAALAAESDNPALAESLRGIEAGVRGELAARNELEGRALYSALYAGAVLGRKLGEDHRRLEAFRVAYEYAETQRGSDRESAERAVMRRRQWEESQRIFASTRRAYQDILVRTAEDYPEELYAAQLGVLVQGFRQSGMEPYVPYAELFVTQSNTYRRDRTLDSDRLLAQILER